MFRRFLRYTGLMTAKILVSGGQKGGTGKTILATNLAAMFGAEGHKVLLLETDPQRSSWDWVKDRELVQGVPIVDCLELSGNLFYSLTELERQFTLIVVDAGGADTDEFRTACAKAHAVYPTVMPSKVDLRTMARVNDVVLECRRIGNTELAARVVINKAPAHPTTHRIETARAKLATHAALEVMETVVMFRAVFQDAYDVGKAVCEIHPESKGAEEMRAIFAQVKRDLQG